MVKKITNDIVIAKAHELGFNLVGFAKAGELKDEYINLQKWLNSGYNAGMQYMERNGEKRQDPRQILEGAESIISLGMNYYTPYNHAEDNSQGKVSRYAWGEDYHLLIWEKLDQFIQYLKETDDKFEAKSYVDTGPVMDKVWAVKAGLGWQGKHSNVINRRQGSWFFIANIITNYIFDYLLPETDHCGSCTACLDACPTNAIIEPYVIDANRCISYLTIENKGDIPAEFEGKFNNWIFGCDICQDVCPWNNKFSQPTTEEFFQPKNGNQNLVLDDIINMDMDDFRIRFKNSPIKRSKIKGIQRNAEFLKRRL